MLLQLSHPPALDGLEGCSARKVKAHDDCIAAFVGEGTVMCILGSRRRVLHGDLAAAFTSLVLSLVVIKGVGGAHTIDEEVLGELDSQRSFSAAIIADQHDSLLAL